MKSIYYFLLMIKLSLACSALFAALPTDNKVYISYNDGIAVYDTVADEGKGRITHIIPFKELRPKLALSLDDTKLYAVTAVGNTKHVTIFDTTTLLKIKTITFLNDKGAPHSIAITKDFAYVNITDDTNYPKRRVVVAVIDIITNKIVKEIEIVELSDNNPVADGISIPLGGNRAFVGVNKVDNQGHFNQIFELDIENDNVKTLATSRNFTLSLIAAPHISKIFVGLLHNFDYFLSVYHKNNGHLIENKSIPNRVDNFAANTNINIKRIYASGSKDIMLINTIDNSFTTVDGRVGFVSNLAINPNNTKLYSLNGNNPNIAIFDVDVSGELTFIKSFSVGPANSGIAASRASSEKVVVAPPHHLRGEVIKNKFFTQTDIVNFLTWKASPDESVTSYNIYRDGKLIGTVLATSRLEFVDHNRRDDKTYVYEVVAANADGVLSSPVTIEIKD